MTVQRYKRKKKEKETNVQKKFSANLIKFLLSKQVSRCFMPINQHDYIRVSSYSDRKYVYYHP